MIRRFAIAMIPLLIIGCFRPSAPPTIVVAEAMTPNEILEKVTTAYKTMETYKAQGTITSDIDTGATKMTMETSFSILLKKPNLYLISWTQKNISMPAMAHQSGTVWSDGTQPYLYMGVMNAHSTMSSDDLALAAATGISGGAANTIPSYFFSGPKEQPTPSSRLIDPKIEMTEKVGGEECYVISGSSPFSKKEAIWVSKTSYLIKKYSRSLEPPEGGRAVPEMTDEQLEEAIKGMGQKVTEESKQKTREMMKSLKTAQLKGSSTELHADILTPDATKNDFQFTPPKDSVLKESLFGGVLGDNK